MNQSTGTDSFLGVIQGLHGILGYGAVTRICTIFNATTTGEEPLTFSMCKCRKT
ncbi:hypothetical protein BDV06DRAFT_195780 [Aspergillus oleicola]